MADWPLPGLTGAESFGLSGSSGKPVTSSASANTKGTWVELAASTTHDASAMLVWLTNSLDLRDHLVDIGIGAASSETVLINNLFKGEATDLRGPNPYFFRVPVPKGARLSARNQCSTGSNLVTVHLQVFYGNYSPGRGVVQTFGAETANSGGTAIDPGGTVDTKGSWVELSASTDHDISELVFGIGSRRNNGQQRSNALFDVGVGAAASEQVILPDIQLGVNDLADGYRPNTLGPFPASIPGGSRVAVRAQSNTTNATDRLFDIVLYGVG